MEQYSGIPLSSRDLDRSHGNKVTFLWWKTIAEGQQKYIGTCKYHEVENH